MCVSEVSLVNCFSFSLSHGSQGLNVGCQALGQAPLPTKLFFQPLLLFIFKKKCKVSVVSLATVPSVVNYIFPFVF